MKVIINGIGVAGPALAYWLVESGHEVLLVEKAPQFRDGGFIVDFWGLGYDIIEKMGLIDEIRRLGYQMREVRYVDARGRKRGGFDVDVFWRLTHDRFTSVRRTDISATMYHAIEGKVETIYGDSVAGFEERERSLHVSFDHAAPRDADLLIGADGQHSRVRQLAFGPEADFSVSLGYHVAALEANGYPHRDELLYVSHGIPGRQISRLSLRDDRTLFLFIMRDEHVHGSDPREIISRAFAGAGWEWPDIAKQVEHADDIYLDSVSQIRMNRWTKGRVALVGDAGACVSLMAGEGTGLAITEAYVLAGELHAAEGDMRGAFSRYEQLLMPFLKKKQSSAARLASSFAPKTSLGLAFRDVVTRLMGIPAIAEYVVGRDLRDDIALPDYQFKPH